MNSFVANPDLAITVARQTIAERVQDAERRREARIVRSERRAARRGARTSYDESTRRRPVLRAFRLGHAAH